MKENFGAICPNFTNPADFILDIANDHKTETGLALIDRMAAFEKEENEKRNLESSRIAAKLDLNGKDQLAIIMNNQLAHSNQYGAHKNESKRFMDPVSGEEVVLASIQRSSFKRDFNFFNEYLLNVKKLMVCSFRDPQQTIFRLANSIIFPVVLYFTVTGEQAKESGCSFLPLNETHILTESVYQRYDRQLKGVQGAGLTFINLMFVYFSALVPGILVLSQHINVLRKEYMNSYYSAHSFYWAIMSVNLFLGLIYSTANTFAYL